MSYAVDPSKVEPCVQFIVQINAKKYEVSAPDSGSAIRQALYDFLDVAYWDEDMTFWWANTHLNSILDSLPPSLEISVFVESLEDFTVETLQ